MENNTNYTKYIAEHLMEHCKRWGYNHIDKLAEHKTPEHFYRIFCKLTKIYYAPIGEDYYNVTFSKDGTVTVKRCGKDFDKRPEDATINIQDILNYLPNREENNRVREENI